MNSEQWSEASDAGRGRPCESGVRKARGDREKTFDWNGSPRTKGEERRRNERARMTYGDKVKDEVNGCEAMMEDEHELEKEKRDRKGRSRVVQNVASAMAVRAVLEQ